ncbi:MAG: carboxypeptidase regulatory-like domain-containing protein [Acidobacteria bacterium]|nr:carboxypeptidase regulatory-like domain-containing protein [Acidobacteriota bacterium]MBI3426688.1 carboxypeptidase regulatory-like domain-containing protein [Acidobacteriota bacterium]
MNRNGCEWFRRAVNAALTHSLLMVAVGLWLSWGAVPVNAQATSTGTVSGQVTDATGATLPGAEIILKDTATNAKLTGVTNEAGRYSFVNVPPGVYDITVTKTGFQRAAVNAHKVTVGTVSTINLSLQIGNVAETVVVTATGTELQTTNATVGTTLSGRQLELLTNLGRDANALMVLQPAVAPGGQVAGAVQDQNTYQLDGGNNTSDMDGTQNIYTQAAGFIGAGAAGGTPSGVLPTPAESIEEFKVGTTNQTADFNGSAGGQIQLVTKRGTNQFHGAVYDHYLGSNFGANSWLNNHTPFRNIQGQVVSPSTPLPSSHQNRFGGNVGGPLTPHFLGGKTYFFAFYEGRRFPQSTNFEKPVPTALMRAGVIQVPDSTGVYRPYNLNPTAVTVNGVTYQPATCGATNVACDPRGIGLNPIVSQIWQKFLPLPNNPTGGDQYNTQGYRGSIKLPQTSDNYVLRLDHDFGPKWRWMASYRYYDFSQLATTQVDIGGALGGTLGQPVSLAPRVQKPGYFVTGLTTTLKPTLTNDFHYSYTRNFWQWGTASAPPQLAGLGGAVEIGGESANALIPYNVNTQSVRQRFWDGIDHHFRDDMTWIKGNHLFQFGGLYQRNWNYHQRNDNGQGIMAANVYQIANIGQNFTTGGVTYIPSTVPAAQNSSWQSLYTQVLGIVGQPQTLYTRKLPDLSLQPLGTPAEDIAIIPTYNVYFSDIWRMKSSFTLTYGLGYTVEMPPFETAGKQVMLVDSAGNAIRSAEYLAKRKAAALAGQVYNPTLGFATIGNVTGKPKYPYDPFYGGLSPRIAASWNPKFASGSLLSKIFGEQHGVVRGGYSRIYGRLNGVDLVLVPLLGTGLMQAVSCQGAVRASAAVNGNQCLGATVGANPLTAFRIGTDGNVAPVPAAAATIPQPYFPGVGGNASAGDGSVLDPSFRPNYSDSFDLTIQRELIPRKLMVEVGYIGRRIGNEYQSVNLDAVPHMTTLGNQAFSAAYANLYQALVGGQTISAQPFFEAALGGPTSAYCTGFANCTAAVASKQATNIRSTRVYDLWANLNSQTSWTLGRTLPSSGPGSQLSSVFMQTSQGYGNYNAFFFSLEARDWKGLTVRSNYTFSKTLGTGAVTQSTSSFTIVDPWDISAMYGTQSFDLTHVYNLSALYEAPFFKGKKGVLGHALGGWTVAPLFQARSAFPLRVSMTQGAGSNCQAFGEVNCASGNTWENAVFVGKYAAGNSSHYDQSFSGTVGRNTNAANNGSGINMFENPEAVYNSFRRLILGLDHRGGGNGVLRGLPTWNLDLSVSKDIHFTERVGMSFLAQFANVLNKFQPSDPSMNLDSPQTFGYINGQANSSRQIEFGLRIHF